MGGDFYDLIDFGTRGAAVVIGDVQGHSVRAAALMGQIRTAIRSYASTGAPPEEVLARTNQLLLDLRTELFSSCLYALVDVPERRVKLASAGHPPPILRDRSDHAKVLDLPPGVLLGVTEEARFESIEVNLPVGALLAFYTDGLVERPGVDIGLSMDLLAHRFSGTTEEPLETLADRIVTGAQETTDDTALLLVECLGNPEHSDGRHYHVRRSGVQ